MLSTDPVFQERDRRGVAKRGMETFPVIERHDVVEQVCLRLGACTVARAMYPLIFQAIEEALGRRVVPAVTSSVVRQSRRTSQHIFREVRRRFF